jgi:hypothetical protein
VESLREERESGGAEHSPCRSSRPGSPGNSRLWRTFKFRTMRHAVVLVATRGDLYCKRRKKNRGEVFQPRRGLSQTFRRLRRWSRCEKNANQAVLSTAVIDSGSRKMFGTSDGILGERLVSKDSIDRQNNHRQFWPAGLADFPRLPTRDFSAAPTRSGLQPDTNIIPRRQERAGEFSKRCRISGCGVAFGPFLRNFGSRFGDGLPIFGLHQGREVSITPRYSSLEDGPS